MTTTHGRLQVCRVADGQGVHSWLILAFVSLAWACFLHLLVYRPSSSLFGTGAVIKARGGSLLLQHTCCAHTFSLASLILISASLF